MPKKPKPKEITIRDLFPDLSESELEEAKAALDAYGEIALQIFERMERERKGMDKDI